MMDYCLKKHTNIPQIIDINAIISEFFAFDLYEMPNKKEHWMNNLIPQQKGIYLTTGWFKTPGC